MSTDIFIYSENKTIAFEILSKGSEVAKQTGGKVCALIAGKEIDETTIAEYCQQGADLCYVIKHANLAEFSVEPYTDAFTQIVKKYQPFALIIGGTKRGKELAPRIATRLSTGCAADCIDIRYNDASKMLEIDRRIYGGASVVTETFKTKPQIITVQPKAFEPLQKDSSRKIEFVEEKVDIVQSNLKVIERREKPAGVLKIEDVQVIVSMGRGVKQKSDIKIIADLAKALGGEIGCSRPIAADLKWLSEDHWVGLSGHKVKPKLYIACGISGQIQHLAGMRDSHIIVAINKDENAPIFKFADYGIIGDLYKIVPKLTELFRKK